MSLRVIITGATGMVGEGVLHECLQHPDVSQILVVGRKSCGTVHPKLTEVIHSDFFNWSPLSGKLSSYDACFFCMGVSSVGMKEDQYTRLTYDLTLGVARILASLNPQMTFCYVSGAGTDSTEKGKSMWARVKGRTENALIQLPFKSAYMFRPGLIKPTEGMKNTLGVYKALGWLYPVIKLLAPKFACSLQEIGLAMIHAAQRGYSKNILEVPDIVELAKWR